MEESADALDASASKNNSNTAHVEQSHNNNVSVNLNNHCSLDEDVTETLNCEDLTLNSSTDSSKSDLTEDGTCQAPGSESRDDSGIGLQTSLCEFATGVRLDTVDEHAESGSDIDSVEVLPSGSQVSPSDPEDTFDDAINDVIGPRRRNNHNKSGLSDTSRRLMPANYDTDDSELRDSYDVSVPADEEEEEERMISGPSRRKRRRERPLSTDSDDETASEVSDVESKSEEKVVAPKANWFPLMETQYREMGIRNNTKYQLNAMASVELTQRLKITSKLDYHEGCVNCLNFNSSGTLLASGSDDLNVCIWDWARSRKYLTFDSGHRSNVFQCKFMPLSGDLMMATCARDGQVRVAELSHMERCKTTRKLAQHKGAAHKLAVHRDAVHNILSCGEDAVIYDIDLRQEKPNKICLVKENDKKVALYSIHANPSNSNEFCLGGRDHYIRIYDKRMITEDTTGPLKKFCPQFLINSEHKANVTCAVYNYNGSEVLGTYNDEDIFLFDATHSDGAEFVHAYTGHRNNATVKGVNFYGPHSEYVVSGSDCGNVFIWEKETELIVRFAEGDDGGVINVLEPHPHLPYLATSGLDHDVKIWTPSAPQPAKLHGLKQVMEKNKAERQEERSSQGEMDGQMLWFLMQHLRRTARRRARHEGGEAGGEAPHSSSSSDSDSDTDSDGPEGGDDPDGRSSGCVPS